MSTLMPLVVQDAPTDDSDVDNEWASRPLIARAIRLAAIVIPVAVSICFAYVLGSVAPVPDGLEWAIARWIAIAACSTVVLALVDRAARRLLPLATLFSLTLTFPDQAPSRYRIALRTGSTKVLEDRIEAARSGDLGDTPAEAAERVLELVAALSMHDRLTRGHSERVRAYAQMIGEELGLTRRELDRLRWAALLHDVGKLMIPQEILTKPGRLTDEEFEIVKTHPERGRELVGPLVPWLGSAAAAVWEHHERFDGTGYPRGLASTEISLAARIVSVADVFDVMTSLRTYQKPMSATVARRELTRCAGTQFDPIVVRAFMSLSLGRLRLAMGPLSWLAQFTMFPAATAAASGSAAAMTAVAGATTATIGMTDAPGMLDRLWERADAPQAAAESEHHDVPAATSASELVVEVALPDPQRDPAPEAVNGIGSSSLGSSSDGDVARTGVDPSADDDVPGPGDVAVAPDDVSVSEPATSEPVDDLGAPGETADSSDGEPLEEESGDAPDVGEGEESDSSNGNGASNGNGNGASNGNGSGSSNGNGSGSSNGNGSSNDDANGSSQGRRGNDAVAGNDGSDGTAPGGNGSDGTGNERPGADSPGAGDGAGGSSQGGDENGNGSADADGDGSTNDGVAASSNGSGSSAVDGGGPTTGNGPPSATGDGASNGRGGQAGRPAVGATPSD